MVGRGVMGHEFSLYLKLYVTGKRCAARDSIPIYSLHPYIISGGVSYPNLFYAELSCNGLTSSRVLDLDSCAHVLWP